MGAHRLEYESIFSAAFALAPQNDWGPWTYW